MCVCAYESISQGQEHREAENFRERRYLLGCRRSFVKQASCEESMMRERYLICDTYVRTEWYLYVKMYLDI